MIAKTHTQTHTNAQPHTTTHPSQQEADAMFLTLQAQARRERTRNAHAYINEMLGDFALTAAFLVLVCWVLANLVSGCDRSSPAHCIHVPWISESSTVQASGGHS